MVPGIGVLLSSAGVNVVEVVRCRDGEVDPCETGVGEVNWLWKCKGAGELGSLTSKMPFGLDDGTMRRIWGKEVVQST